MRLSTCGRVFRGPGSNNEILQVDDFGLCLLLGLDHGPIHPGYQASLGYLGHRRGERSRYRARAKTPTRPRAEGPPPGPSGTLSIVERRFCPPSVGLQHSPSPIPFPITAFRRPPRSGAYTIR